MLRMLKMINMLKYKHGQVSSLSIAFTIITIFVILGTVLPFINRDLGVTTTIGETSTLESEVSQDSGNLNAVSALDIAKSVAKMFFWSFGDFGTGIFGVILEGIFLILRISLVLILIQYIPFVG